MQLNDTPQNTRFYPVFVEHFQWEDPLDNEKFAGHPKAGRVYRIGYNSDTNSYRIFYKEKDGKNIGIYLPVLTDCNAYSAKIYEITKKSVLDFDIKEEDIEMMGNWLITNNADLMMSLGFTPKQQLLPTTIFKVDVMNQEESLSKEFIESAKLTQSLYPMLFEALHEVMSSLDNYDVGQSLDGISLSFSEKHGAGHNIGKALEALSYYVSDDPRASLDREDLIAAIINLLNELARRSAHDRG